MAYRRRPPSFYDDYSTQVGDDLDRSISNSSSSSSSSSWLAAQAIRASSAHRDSSLSSAYSSPLSNPTTTTTAAAAAANSPSPSPTLLKDSKRHQYTSMKNLNESKSGFWGNLARKAKAILDDDDYGGSPQVETPEKKTQQMPSTTDSGGKYHNTYRSSEGHQKSDSPALKKGLGAITSSLNYIGGTIGKSVEEGISIVENRTAGIIQETRKHIRKNSSNSVPQNQATKQPHMQAQVQQPLMQNDQDLQLKASRDVAMAMAAKAKLLLRELKTVKADLAFAKERCAQLEDENRILRESRERGDSPEDDDLIRLQLESLLAEKARLAHENSVYARENRFLREVVEYHQLTMQDVVYLDEGTEEVTEVYPIKVVSNPNSAPSTPTFPPSPVPPEGTVLHTSPQITRDVFPCPSPPPEFATVSQSAVAPPSSVSPQ
ncbi:hypothetical protein Dsin_028129 [Dipteronia sinensis]|uniref:Uncharacterized protein n=1 Tax=Dipteronia sinensis TaxID=43782 RepID=A0AAD9ZQ32_9ROSI|nr:hypothetical protein Dsin_028129 [Dipteronia sinensis]